MHSFRKLLLLHPMLMLLLVASSSASADDQMQEKINPKDIVVKTPFNPADYVGSYVILAFVSHYYRECNETILSLNKLNDKYNGSGVKVVGVYVDGIIDENEIREFADKENIHFPLYIENHHMINEHNIIFIPTILFLDTTGSVIEQHIGHKNEKVLEKEFFLNHNNKE